MIRAVNARGDNEEVAFLNAVFSGVSPGQTPNLYEFDDEFDDVDAPLGQCTVLYNFEGAFGSRTPSDRPEIHAFCSRWATIFFTFRQQRGHHIHHRGRAAEHHGGGQRGWMDEGAERQR